MSEFRFSDMTLHAQNGRPTLQKTYLIKVYNYYLNNNSCFQIVASIMRILSSRRYVGYVTCLQ
jgi:hypothetical protein